jgi:carbon-monoxide dehydrogenase iron sulfur subunit
MKILATRPERCTGCGKCEIACSLHWFKVEDRAKSRIRINPPAEAGRPYAINVCSQIGACMDVCPTLALKRDKHGVVQLHKKLCIGCLSCVGFCPTMSMFYHADYIEPFKCVACGKCVEVCPENVLSIIEVPDAPAHGHRTVAQAGGEVR